MKNKFYVKLLNLIFVLLLLSSELLPQTSGKLSGRIIDNTGEPLIGSSIIVEGTKQGAVTDVDGYYTILNIRAGIYSISFRSIGYQTKIIQNVKINADQTTKLDEVLSTQAVVGEAVTIVAQRPLVEFNQTSSISTFGKDELENLPVQGLNEIVNLQAGVVDGHFRGGRIGEVQYQVDGVTVNNPYNNSSTLQLDRSVIEEVQVISGTFDAKYGQAMSGVVNAVLKTGSDRFEWSGELFGGDFYTTDSKRYPDNKDFNPSTVQNYQLTISGPTYLQQTTFFVSGRKYVNNGYLFGYRRFNPTDKNDLENKIFNPTGDNKRIAMQTNHEWSGQFKITNQSIDNVQFSYQATYQKLKRTYFSEEFRLNPDGIKPNFTTSITHGLQFTHTLSDKMFYKIDLRQNYFDYKDYKYESIFDPRYLEEGSPKSDANYEDGAIVQGVDLGRFKQETNSGIIKGDFTWQYDRSNMIETGVEVQLSKMIFGTPGFLVPTFVNDQEILQPRISIPRTPGVQTYYPKQFAAYLQDRLEWGDLIVRAGLRFEYFDADALLPSDFQNPANSIQNVPESHLVKTKVKYALAPRLGFSFPLTANASIYFSYGHFYQMPGLGLLYSNADYSILNELQAGGISYGVMGNPDLNPERTVQYECGLKQALTSFLGLELSFFYKDIRDLLGVAFQSTYAAAEYARFTNVDFGSAYGFTVSLTQRAIGPLTTSLDYTLQFAQGNSSDPRESANRAASGKDSRPRDIPFGWDQHHTLNAVAILNEPDNYSLSAIVKFGSGQPFTPEIGLGFGADLETNSGRKESFVLVDLRAEKFFSLGLIDLSVFARIFNLLNTHYVNGFVFNTTGSPDYSVNPVADKVMLRNPARFQEPRRIEIGISFRSK
jgi:outer membrane receptor protein involved in Fe transport